jgi:hypothetical protein
VTGARALLALATLVAACLLPAVAFACPACALRDTPAMVFVWMGLMIAVPYLIVVVAIRTIRRLEREP